MLNKFIKICLKSIFSLLCMLFLSTSLLAESKKIIWQQTYYPAVPTNPYCQLHIPGTFVGSVSDQLKNGALTNKNITLSQFTFHIINLKVIYLMYGSVHAQGKNNQQVWDDKINYYLYKLTEQGITRDVWSSKYCKGCTEVQ